MTESIRVPVDTSKVDETREPVSNGGMFRSAQAVSATLQDLRRGEYYGVGDDPLRVAYDGVIPRPLVETLAAACPTETDVRYLYVLTGPSGVIYVGQTWNPAARLPAHRKKSKFWGRATEALVLQHRFAHEWPNADGEVVEIERGLIWELQPIYNLDRPLCEADRGAPWEADLRRSNSAATRRARRLLGRG